MLFMDDGCIFNRNYHYLNWRTTNDVANKRSIFEKRKFLRKIFFGEDFVGGQELPKNDFNGS